MRPGSMPAERMPRRALDAYDTPPWQVDALVDHVPAIGGSVWEPCAGDGSLIARLLERKPAIEFLLTMDIDPARHPMIVGDATDPVQWLELQHTYGRPSWVITNPPFKHAHAILDLAIATATVGVIVLTRLSFAEPTKSRGAWLVTHPHDQRITLERHSYNGTGKSDNVTTEWLVFVKDWRILTPPFGICAYGYKSRA
jgi:hypothetical protein